METIILVTVLSTLGVVSLVTAIVVAFNKLNKKVDVNGFEKEIDNVYKQQSDIEGNISHEFDSRSESLNNELSNIHRHIDECMNDVNRRIDELGDNVFRTFGPAVIGITAGGILEYVVGPIHERISKRYATEDI